MGWKGCIKKIHPFTDLVGESYKDSERLISCNCKSEWNGVVTTKWVENMMQIHPLDFVDLKVVQRKNFKSNKKYNMGNG